jgi:anthranilate phosphoribosyltransferase
MVFIGGSYLAHHGYKIVMHGASGHTINRVYTEQVLQYLDYQICHSEQEVRKQLENIILLTYR